MPRMLHNLLCTVSRRYRLAHCRHVDELPPRMSRSLREDCRELCPRSYGTFAEMRADFERECVSEVIPSFSDEEDLTNTNIHES